MRVGLAFNVKPADTPDHLPEDAFEEYDSEATVAHIENALSRLGHDVRRLPAGRGFVDAVRYAARPTSSSTSRKGKAGGAARRTSRPSSRCSASRSSAPIR